MNNALRNICAVGLAAVLLQGCGTVADPTTWGRDKPIAPPAELVEFDGVFRTDRIWSHDTGGGFGDLALNLRPAVEEDRVYLADFGGRVEALDLATGRVAWQVTAAERVSGGPGVGEGLVAVGTMNAEVVALSQADGSERWRARVSGEVLSSPLVRQGTVVVHTLDGSIQGLDASSGRNRWSYVSEVPVLTLRGSSSPVATGNLVICGLSNGKVVALDIESGRAVWESRVGVPSGRSELDRMADIDGDPLIHGNTVYAASYQGDVAALGEQSGLLLWRQGISSYSRMAAGQGRIYVATDRGAVTALNADTGEVEWTNDALTNRRLSDLAVVGDYVAVGDFEGYVHWLSTTDGSFASRTRVGNAPITTGMLSVRDVLYVQSHDGSVEALQVPPGN